MSALLSADEPAQIICGQTWLRDSDGERFVLDAYADGTCFLVDRYGRDTLLHEDVLRRDYTMMVSA